MESILQLRLEMRTLEQLIREDLQAAIYLNKYMKDPQNEQDGRKSGIYGIDDTLGDGDSDTIHLHVKRSSRFFRNLPFDYDPEIYEVGYFLEEMENGRYNFKRREEFYIDPDITDGEESIVHSLSDNVVSFNIKYYKGTNIEPLDEWDSSQFEETKDKNSKIPAGMDITLELKNESGETLKSSFQVNLHPYMGTAVEWE